MAVFEVESGAPLMGEATIHPAKNAALPVIAAALLTADELVVPDMPDLTDVRAMCDLVAACGAKKVYLMLGMNCIAGGVDRAANDLVTLVGQIREQVPDAAILIESVTPMTQTSPRADDALNNDTIGQFNARMQQYCQENQWYYVDVAEALSDESGYLRDDYSGDTAMGIHLDYKGAGAWAGYLLSHVPAALR